MTHSTAITRVHAREVLDSRGNPTVEVELWAGESVGRAIVPSGASTGRAEAHELRDGDSARFEGRGVQKAVGHVTGIITQSIIGLEADEQFAVDDRLLQLDSTPQKTRLGANSTLGVSLAAAHLAAAVHRVPLYRHIAKLFAQRNEISQVLQVADELRNPQLPLAMINMISGGRHAGGNLDFQDVLAMPVGAPDFSTGLEWTVRVYRRLGRLLTEAGYEGQLVGDEGGYGPRLETNRQALEFVVRAIDAAGLAPGDDVALALDVAASEFYEEQRYRLAAEGINLTSADMIDGIAALADDFPLRSVEDPLAEEDWDGWCDLTARLGKRLQIVGDDLFATHRARVERGIASGAANAVLIKPNQVGTLTETFNTMLAARAAGFDLIVSARSGETEDTTIVDLAVGTAAEGIKIGSVVRGERLAKYNRLLRIEEELRFVD